AGSHTPFGAFFLPPTARRRRRPRMVAEKLRPAGRSSSRGLQPQVAQIARAFGHGAPAVVGRTELLAQALLAFCGAVALLAAAGAQTAAQLLQPVVAGRWRRRGRCGGMIGESWRRAAREGVEARHDQVGFVVGTAGGSAV